MILKSMEVQGISLVRPPRFARGSIVYGQSDVTGGRTRAARRSKRETGTPRLTQIGKIGKIGFGMFIDS